MHISHPKPAGAEGGSDDIHTKEELQQMFESFGLGTEEDRERFRRLAEDFMEPADQPNQLYEFHLSNMSEGAPAERAENAELAPDPE